MYNQRIFFWCCKTVGLACLQYLLTTVKPRYPRLKIVGICISSKDRISPKIIGLAHEHNIQIFDETSILQFKADLGLCIGFPQKISQSVINQCRRGVINLHFAPLPQYRGSGTLEQAIINGESKYGLTLHYMDQELDTGPIITVHWVDLPSDITTKKMVKKLEKIAINFFNSYCELFVTTQLKGVDQDYICVRDTIAPQLCNKKKLLTQYQLSLNWSEIKLDRYLRGLKNGKKLKPFVNILGRKVYLEYEG